MADNNGENGLSVNSDFERVPNTPMEREEDVDLDLDGGQKTPKGIVTSELGDQQSEKPASIDPIVAALMKKVDILVAQNSELRTHLAVLKHDKEHENAEFVLVDNAKGAFWDTAESQFMVKKFTVKNEDGGVSIRSTRGFSTVPHFTDSLIFNVNNYEVTVDEMPADDDDDNDEATIHIGFVAENFPLDHLVGKSYHSFGITADGTLWKSGRQRSNFARGDLSVGDTVGCAIAVGSKTATAEAVNCRRCLEKPSWLFFTKNGKIWGNPIPLPSNLPSTMFPAVSLSVGCKVTANFGARPFKFVPSAAVAGLNCPGDCICHNGFSTTPRIFCSAAGTNVLKFSPPTESDTMLINSQRSQVTTKQMSISAMEEYETRSLEELRLADYIAGRGRKRKVNTSAAPANVLEGETSNNNSLAALHAKVAEQQAVLATMRSKYDHELNGVRKENIVLALASHLGTPSIVKNYLNPEFVELTLVNNTENAAWDLVDSAFSVSGNSVTKKSTSCQWYSVRSKRGFSIEPTSSNSNPSKVNLLFHYFETTIDKAQSGIFIGLAPADHHMLNHVGDGANSFGVNNDGTFLHYPIAIKESFGPGGFVKGDTVGCGLLIVQHEAIQYSRWIFFTKNGKIWGTPVALPLDVPSILYPTVSIFQAGDKVTANFGTKPFKYGIPPAEGLLC